LYPLSDDGTAKTMGLTQSHSDGVRVVVEQSDTGTWSMLRSITAEGDEVTLI
jgi:hypothetical protein